MRQHGSKDSEQAAMDSAPQNASRKTANPLRKALVTLLVLVSLTVDVGCFVPIYSSSRDDRARQLIFVSEGLRHIPQVWERIWGLDMPDTATPYRVHGGVI